MGAEDVASGVLYVGGEDTGILSAVVAMAVMHFSMKFSVGKCGRAAGVAGSLFNIFGAATNLVCSCVFVYRTFWVRATLTTV